MHHMINQVILATLGGELRCVIAISSESVKGGTRFLRVLILRYLMVPLQLFVII